MSVDDETQYWAMQEQYERNGKLDRAVFSAAVDAYKKRINELEGALYTIAAVTEDRTTTLKETVSATARSVLP